MKKKVYLKINEKDMDAIEDAFFADLNNNPKHYKKVMPRLIKIWKKLCSQMDN